MRVEVTFTTYLAVPYKPTESWNASPKALE